MEFSGFFISAIYEIKSFQGTPTVCREMNSTLVLVNYCFDNDVIIKRYYKIYETNQFSFLWKRNELIRDSYIIIFISHDAVRIVVQYVAHCAANTNARIHGLGQCAFRIDRMQTTVLASVLLAVCAKGERSPSRLRSHCARSCWRHCSRRFSQTALEKPRWLSLSAPFRIPRSGSFTNR